jgi:Zn-dependent protease with chaperone function
MDRATRNFVMLSATALVLVAYGLCGLIAYGILPLLDGRASGDPIGLFAVAGLGALLTVSIFLGVRTLWREGTAARALSRHIDTTALPQPSDLRLAAREAGLSGRVSLVDSPKCCSFVYGALAPRVALSRSLHARLSIDELRAALEHERYHVDSLDPLRSVVSRAAVDGLFFLPALRTLQGRYEVARELAADRRAVRLVGPRPLAGALLKAMEAATTDHPATIPLATPRSLDSRLDQLETGREPTPAGLDRISLGATALGVLAFLALLVTAPLAAGGGVNLIRGLAPASLLEGAIICLLPLVAASAVVYRRLRVRPTRLLLPSPRS